MTELTKILFVGYNKEMYVRDTWLGMLAVTEVCMLCSDYDTAVSCFSRTERLYR